MDIENEIVRFITCKENNGALLLTGNWGCGKTYQIRRIRDELNKSEYLILITSLFGAVSCENLLKRIKKNLFDSMNLLAESQGEKVEKAKPIIKATASILGELNPLLKGLQAAVSIDPLDFIEIKREVSLPAEDIIKELILVFDDFERSKIDVVDLLGFINDFSENKGIKCIVIADENKISEEKYLEFKEKLISRTIQLVPDYEQIINSIIESYKETTSGYKDFLRNNSRLIHEVFATSKTNNLRTVKTIFIDFERAYAAWNSQNCAAKHLPHVFYSFAATMFEFRAGNFVKSSEYGYVFEYKKVQEKYPQYDTHASWFPSLQHWITDGIWDESAFLREIQAKYNLDQLTPLQRFLQYHFWDLEYAEIETGLPEAYELACKGEMPAHFLITFLEKLQALHAESIPLPCTVDYNAISDGWQKRMDLLSRGEISESIPHTFILPEVLNKMPEIAQSIYKSIEQIDYKIYAWNNRRDFMATISDPLETTFYKLYDRYFVTLDDGMRDLFFAQYAQRDNHGKRFLSLLIKKMEFGNSRVTSQTDFDKTKENINCLITSIQQLDENETDEITKAIIKHTVSALSDFHSNLTLR